MATSLLSGLEMKRVNWADGGSYQAVQDVIDKTDSINVKVVEQPYIEVMEFYNEWGDILLSVVVGEDQLTTQSLTFKELIKGFAYTGWIVEGFWWVYSRKEAGQ